MSSTPTRAEVSLPDRAGFALMCITAAFAPLMFGAAERHWTLVLVVLLSLGLPLLSTARLEPAQFRQLLLPACVTAGAFMLAVWLQSADVLVASVDAVLWRDAGAALGRALPHGGAIATGYPWASLGRPACFFLALLAGIVIGSRRSRGDRLMQVIAYSTLGYACIGLAQYIFQPERLLWIEKRAYLGFLTGPFVNRNTAATYFGMGSLLFLARLLVSIEPRLAPAAGASPSLRHLFSLSLSRREVIHAIAFAVLLSATFLTGSRAGSLLTLLLCAAVAAAVLHYRLDSGMKSPRLIFAALVIFGVGVLAAALVSSLSLTRGLSDPARAEIYEATLRMARDHLWLGTGLGTFELAIPAYRLADTGTIGVWDYAHSTPLELLAEMGAPLFCLVVAFWAWLGIVMLRAIVKAPVPRPMLIASSAAALLAVGHSCIDFSLQIPGFSVPFAMLFGAGLSRALIPVGLPRRRSSTGTTQADADRPAPA